MPLLAGRQETIYPLLARTATPTETVRSSQGARGLIVVTHVSAIAATPGLTINIDDMTNPDNPVLILAGAQLVAVTAAGSPQKLRVYPALTAAANLVANDVCPTQIRIRPVHLDADSITYSVAVSFLP